MVACSRRQRGLVAAHRWSAAILRLAHRRHRRTAQPPTHPPPRGELALDTRPRDRVHTLACPTAAKLKRVPRPPLTAHPCSRTPRNRRPTSRTRRAHPSPSPPPNHSHELASQTPTGPTRSPTAQRVV